MIRGHVLANHDAVIELQLVGPQKRARVVEAVIDTGFSGYLCLPPKLIESLRLPLRHTETYTLADDTDVELDVHKCHVLWDGGVRPAFAAAGGGDVLVGMSLIHGYRLTIEARTRGAVVIDALAV